DPSALETACGPGSEAQERPRLALQWALLQSGWRALRPGGVLVYSTCTLNDRENEAQCRRLLEAEPSAEPLDLAPLLGLPQEAGDASGQGFVRIWPHAFDTEGFFLGCFRKLSSQGGGAEPA
ncbi:unnamed protein product, partial [Prorocentrum cordatum]